MCVRIILGCGSPLLGLSSISKISEVRVRYISYLDHRRLSKTRHVFNKYQTLLRPSVCVWQCVSLFVVCSLHVSNPITIRLEISKCIASQTLTIIMSFGKKILSAP